MDKELTYENYLDATDEEKYAAVIKEVQKRIENTDKEIEKTLKENGEEVNNKTTTEGWIASLAGKVFAMELILELERQKEEYEARQNLQKLYKARQKKEI